MMQYKNTRKPLPQIAKELHVDAVVEGSVLREGGQVRITAQLIDAKTDRNLWAESYQRDSRSVLALQNDIATAVAGKIRVALTPAERSDLAKARPVNPKAYEAYLRGKFFLDKMTPEGFEKGLAYMQQAIRIDPNNPSPYAGLALAYCRMGHDRFPDAFSRAEAAARKAVALGGELAETQLALGEIKFYKDWDVAAAGPYYQSALQLNPSLAEAHRQYSWYLNVLGRTQEAFAEMARAEETDPLSPLYPADLAWQYWEVGQYKRAMQEARKSLEMSPNFGEGLTVVGYVYADQKMYDKAIAAHRKAAAADKAWRWPLGIAYARAGRRAEALALAAELKKEPTPMNAWGLAQIYTALGDKDQALHWLRVAYKSRFSFIPWLNSDPRFAALRSDPRFQELASHIRFPKN